MVKKILSILFQVYTQENFFITKLLKALINGITAPQFLNHAIVLLFNGKQRLWGFAFPSYMGMLSIWCTLWDVSRVLHCSSVSCAACTQTIKWFSPEDHGLETMLSFCSSRASSTLHSSLLEFKIFTGGNLRVPSSTQVLYCRHTFSLLLSPGSNFILSPGFHGYHWDRCLFPSSLLRQEALRFLLEVLCSLLRNLQQEWNIDVLGKL